MIPFLAKSLFFHESMVHNMIKEYDFYSSFHVADAMLLKETSMAMTSTL